MRWLRGSLRPAIGAGSAKPRASRSASRPSARKLARMPGRGPLPQHVVIAPQRAARAGEHVEVRRAQEPDVIASADCVPYRVTGYHQPAPADRRWCKPGCSTPRAMRRSRARTFTCSSVTCHGVRPVLHDLRIHLPSVLSVSGSLPASGGTGIRSRSEHEARRRARDAAGQQPAGAGQGPQPLVPGDR